MSGKPKYFPFILHSPHCFGTLLENTHTHMHTRALGYGKTAFLKLCFLGREHWEDPIQCLREQRLLLSVSAEREVARDRGTGTRTWVAWCLHGGSLGESIFVL